MTSRIFSALIGSLLLSLAFFLPSAQAQDWRQEVQIITTVGYGEPLHIFTDSLIAVLARNPDLLVRREAHDPTPISAQQLRETLYEDGIDVNSASHAFIRYQFELGKRSEITETIKDIYFIYRGSESQADLPILYLSTQDPIISNLIRTRGIPSLVNMSAVNTFRSLFAFPYLRESQEMAVVEIAGRSLRGDNPLPEQQILENFLIQHRGEGGSYVLALPRPATVVASPMSEPVSSIATPSQQ